MALFVHFGHNKILEMEERLMVVRGPLVDRKRESEAAGENQVLQKGNMQDLLVTGNYSAS